MTDVIKSVQNLKVSADLMDLLLAGVVKYFTEKALTKYVGNGNLFSGLTKLGLGVGVDMFGGSSKIAKIGKTAFVIDGVEDITQFVMGQVSGKIPAMNGGNSQPQFQTI